MRMAILCIVQDGHFFIVEIDFIYKSINECLPILFVVYIALFELIQEKLHFLQGRHYM